MDRWVEELWVEKCRMEDTWMTDDGQYKFSLSNGNIVQGRNVSHMSNLHFSSRRDVRTGETHFHNVLYLS